MNKRLASRMVVASLLTFVIAALVGIKISGWNSPAKTAAQKTPPAENGLVVHEWGTFTSIAGKDGIALEWRPLNAPSDLPGFVHTIQKVGAGIRHPGKRDLSAAIRMETPVIYFYSGSEMNVSVKVDFPKGKITEWYPQARSVNAGLDWGRLKVMPGAALNFPAGYSASHYYAARETDAAPVQVCGTDGKQTQQEKFLFYRGVGTFDLPLSVRLDGQNVLLQNVGKDEIAHLIVFENRGGKIGYRMLNNFSGELTSQRFTLDKDLNSLLQELKQILVASGLYEREAEAMIKTWRDSWFEEGMRVFYVLPRQTTDTVLPITIEPSPAELVRVLVGRTEVITPEMEKAVQQRVSQLGDPSPQVRASAMQAIRQYGRFSEPILKRILETEKDNVIRGRIRQLIETPAAAAE